MKHFRSVDEYLKSLPQESKTTLETFRETIRQAAPQAAEIIHYNMPAFEWNGILVWYAAYKKHIGFYPRASAIAAFRAELGGYTVSKGGIRFPLKEAIPAGLIKKIVRFRVKEKDAKAKGKNK